MINCQRLSSVFLALTLAAGAATFGCSKEEKAPPTTKVEKIQKKPEAPPNVNVSFKLTGKEKQKLNRLYKGLKGKNLNFPKKEAARKQNARLFTYAAATATKHQRIVAGLSAMRLSYGPGKAKVDADFANVVAYHLKSKDPIVLQKAFVAAGVGLQGLGAKTPLLAEVLSVGAQQSSSAGRLAALSALRNLAADQHTEETVQLFAASLGDKEPSVVASALSGLSQASAAVKTAAPIVEQTLPLAKHADPAVRGLAIEVLGKIAGDRPETTATALAALSDTHPFVRASACNALGSVGQASAIHALVPLVEDGASSHYELGGWKQLSGKPSSIEFEASPLRTVSDAAQRAVATLSAGGLKLEPVAKQETAAGLKRNADATKAWYASEKPRLPAAGSVTKSKLPNTTAAKTTTGAAKPAEAAKPATAPAAVPAAK
jgi:HEAT repeats